MSVRTSSLVAGLLITVGRAAAANGATVLALTGGAEHRSDELTSTR